MKKLHLSLISPAAGTTAHTGAVVADFSIVDDLRISDEPDACTQVTGSTIPEPDAPAEREGRRGVVP